MIWRSICQEKIIPKLLTDLRITIQILLNRFVFFFLKKNFFFGIQAILKTFHKETADGFEVSEKTFRFVVRNVNRLVPGSTQASEAHMIRGLPWKILVIPRQREGVLNSLGFFLQEGFKDFIFYALAWRLSRFSTRNYIIN